MSTEKLSELSKPVGFIEQSGMAYLRSGADADIWPDGGRGGDIPLYSQEYVSALLAELEAKDKRIAELSRLLAHNIERAEKAEKRLVYPKDAIATWERKAISNFDECAIMSQRIIELEAIKSDASQVFKEIGNELGCNPDNESIMMAIDALKERLATPVRLPEKYNMKMAGDKSTKSMFYGHNSAINDSAKAIRAAGFAVEGDE